jgi:hypothetical protein
MTPQLMPGLCVELPAALPEHGAALYVAEVRSDGLHVLNAPNAGQKAVRFKLVLDGQRIQFGLPAHPRVEPLANG